MQAEAANARFLAFAPPPPGGAAAVCLVDTGLDINPDTETSAAARIALDDGDPGDVHPSRHGTRMAMLMGGPVNDWGSVGIWPHIRIVSIRAMPPGETTFPFHYYEQAILACGERAEPERIVAVNLSLGGVGATEEQVTRLTDRIASVNRDGTSVVAAAGNAGGSVEYPAAIDAATAVAASGPDGAFCHFSARGAQLDLAAPGCALEAALADGTPARASGTSDATAIVSAILAALRSYRPSLRRAEAEDLLLRTARTTPDGRVIDAEAAFRAAGLGDIVDAGNAAVPRRHDESIPPAAPPPAQAPAVSTSLPRPRLRALRHRGGRLRAHVANRPAGATVSVTVHYVVRAGEFRMRSQTAARAANVVSLRAPARWTRVKLLYRTRSGERSPALVVHRRVHRVRGGG